jgi:hypothetical protein
MNSQSCAVAPEELSFALAHFSGSESFTSWSILFRRDRLTDGAKYLAEKCGAYWLMDAIASWQCDPRVRGEVFQVWKLRRCDESNFGWELVLEDGGRNGEPSAQIVRQFIQYSDFPLKNIRLFAQKNEIGGITIMLPSEY